MVFTFQPIDASLIGLFTKKLKARSTRPRLFSPPDHRYRHPAYPEDARDMLVAAIEEATPISPTTNC
jgi:hypothetical protein